MLLDEEEILEDLDGLEEDYSKNDHLINSEHSIRRKIVSEEL